MYVCMTRKSERTKPSVKKHHLASDFPVAQSLLFLLFVFASSERTRFPLVYTRCRCARVRCIIILWTFFNIPFFPSRSQFRVLYPKRPLDLLKALSILRTLFHPSNVGNTRGNEKKRRRKRTSNPRTRARASPSLPFSNEENATTLDAAARFLFFRSQRRARAKEITPRD